jgi:hypothetical protein
MHRGAIYGSDAGREAPPAPGGAGVLGWQTLQGERGGGSRVFAAAVLPAKSGDGNERTAAAVVRRRTP